MNQNNCTGCDTCGSFCPTEAIQGSLRVAHKISVIDA
ncbi:MAG: 4Fe-4S binding protein [Campylobacteraceae bacterium]|nr:4Fe-4S binding protein [Campylobacteraceae bacterium]